MKPSVKRIRKGRFKHDCTSCTFLAYVRIDGVSADLYHCMQDGSIPTVIARFSNEPSDNISGLAFAPVDLHLGVAKELAYRKKLPLDTSY
jgi:hypothetical protein